MAQPMTAPLRIGIIGAGTIGRVIAETLLRQTDGRTALGWICTRSVEKARAWAGETPIVADMAEALARPVDLVVEAALPDVMRAMVPAFLERCDVMPFSLTPLAEQAFYDRLSAIARQAGRRLILPKGAIVGLDGIIAAQSILTSVRMTTTKSPESLGQPADKAGVLFSGSTRDAVVHFPRNTNVHVAVALAGVGLDRTQSIVTSAPGLKTMRHLIEVEGEGLAWSIDVESLSLGGVSGAFVPLSAAMSALHRAAQPPGIHFE